MLQPWIIELFWDRKWVTFRKTPPSLNTWQQCVDECIGHEGKKMAQFSTKIVEAIVTLSRLEESYRKSHTQKVREGDKI